MPCGTRSAPPPTASALMIGLALVTLVSVLAVRAEDDVQQRRRLGLQGRLRADGDRQLLPHLDRVGASAGEGAGRQRRLRRPRRRRQGVRQQDQRHRRPRRHLQGHRRATGRTARRRLLDSSAKNGAFVDKATRRAQHLSVGSPIAVEVPSGKTLHLTLKGIFAPPKGGSPYGDVTISQQRFDAEYQNPQNLFAFVDMAGGVTAANTATLTNALERVPRREDRDRERVQEEPGAGDQHAPQPALRAALALDPDQSLRHREHARPDGVRANARARHAARDRDDAAAGTPDDPAREHRHGADRRRARASRSAWCSRSWSARRSTIPAFTIPWGTLIVFVIAAILAGLVAAILPARRAGKLNVLQALQYE